MLSPSSTPAAARTELKKLLQARNVRKTIADGIMVRIFAGESAAPSGRNTPASGSGLEEGIGGITLGPSATSGVVTPVNEEIEIVYVSSILGRGLTIAHPFYADCKREGSRTRVCNNVPTLPGQRNGA